MITAKIDELREPGRYCLRERTHVYHRHIGTNDGVNNGFQVTSACKKTLKC